MRSSLRLPSWGLAAVLAGVLVCGGVAWSVVSCRIVQVSPRPSAWTRKPAAEIVVRYAGMPGAASISVDGRALPVREAAAESLLKAHAADLRDGRHRIVAEIRPRFGFAPVRRAWILNVETTPPPLDLTSPRPGQITKESSCRVAGRTRPGARVTARGETDAAVTVDASGRFEVTIPLAENDNRIRIEAVDRAGNHTRASREVIYDRTPPVISNASTVPAVFHHQRDVTLQAQVREEGAGLASVRMVVDGRAEPIHLAPQGGKVDFTARDLPEGRRDVRLEVTDRAGWTATHDWSFVLETASRFGDRPMTSGAEGPAVTGLQQRLAKWGALGHDEISGTYDERTEQAVKEFQERHHLKPDGIVGYATIGALSPKILIDETRRRLTLYDMGKKVKSYAVAVGMPEHPTPTGDFRIVEKKLDPPWIPPKHSAWARNAKEIPPGPNNPLGTRWMGLSANGVGIHGTNEPWEIGTRASHGCVRMHTKDAEDLFNRVNDGTEVKIFWEPPKKVARRG